MIIVWLDIIKTNIALCFTEGLILLSKHLFTIMKSNPQYRIHIYRLQLQIFILLNILYIDICTIHVEMCIGDTTGYNVYRHKF